MTMLSPDPHPPQDGVLLRELHHRVDRGIDSAIEMVSAAVIRADGAEAKAALGDVVELLHGYAALHQTLATLKGEALQDAAAYIRKLGCAMRQSLLDRMGIRLALPAGPFPLQSKRCWLVGLIVHDLIANAAKHACFGARAGEIKVKLTRIGTVVNCVVLDNGSRSVRAALGREPQIGNDLAKGLGGRIEHGFGAEFTSVVLSFRLNERERQASWSMATRRMRSPRRLRARSTVTPGSGCDSSDQVAAGGPDSNLLRAHSNDLASLSRGSDVLGELLSPSNSMGAL